MRSPERSKRDWPPAVPVWQLTDEVRYGDGRCGVRPPDGDTVLLRDGDHLVKIQKSDDSGHRDLYIQTASGEQIPFDAYVRFRETVDTFEQEGHLGEILAQAYEAAVEEAPLLAEAEIIIAGRDDDPRMSHTGGFDGTKIAREAMVGSIKCISMHEMDESTLLTSCDGAQDRWK
jgi:hypothetical protein